MTGKTLKDQQFGKTHRALMAAGHELFAEQGYVATSTQDIVHHAGVTSGALYYHSKDKAALFRAVFTEL